MGKLIDLTGQRFDMLTVIERDYSEPIGRGYQARWVCKCDCGGSRIVTGDKLTSGKVKNCGCTSVRNEKKKRVLEKLKKANVEYDPKSGYYYKMDANKYSDSLCWGCIRAAAPMELQCEWVKTSGLTAVDGAKLLHKGYVIQGRCAGEEVRVVVDCPMFLDDRRSENRELLQEARKRRKAEENKQLTELRAVGDVVFNLKDLNLNE